MKVYKHIEASPGEGYIPKVGMTGMSVDKIVHGPAKNHHEECG